MSDSGSIKNKLTIEIFSQKFLKLMYCQKVKYNQQSWNMVLKSATGAKFENELIKSEWMKAQKHVKNINMNFT